VIVAHGDPITLASDRLGRYAVMINANDIAASGAIPRWLLTTVLLPGETTPSQALALLDDIARTAAEQGVTLVGGHTEVIAAVSRPVVSATMLAPVDRSELREKRAVRPGDSVLLTKALAVEGTALLAQEMGEHLRALGMTAAQLSTCRDLLEQVSIVPEARIAAGFAGVHAMHDVTEGGLATALAELASASGHGITVHCERIPVLPQTAQICALLAADPLGLIASGSLLICCASGEVAALERCLNEADVAVAVIGEVAEPGGGVSALQRGLPAPWPQFAADEAARLLEQLREP